MRIVFVASECVPYSKTGGLADVVGALPQALAALGHQVDVLIPRYRMTKPGPVVREAANVTIPVASGFRFATVQQGGVAKGLRHYLIDCPEFFDREGLYQAPDGTDYPDNPVRFGGFCLSCLEFLKRLPDPPDILHCHDWQTALTPVHVKRLYANDPFFRQTSTVLTIHNLGYQGLFAPDILPQISVDQSLFSVEGLEFFGKVNFLKGGIIFADSITTVSRKYAEEIQSSTFGYGLEGVLRLHAGKLRGILNGADYDAWNPATDKLIPAQYTPEKLEAKQVCKKALLRKMGVVEPLMSRPVIGIVSRFATQKGFDLIALIADELMKMHLYVVALGTGEPEFEELFRSLRARYPEKFLVKIAYDNELAHQIEAGSDIFLMPSLYEPCGLNQMYSLKYGTVPVVRATGGLDDTIQEFDGTDGTGFKFTEYSAEALLVAICKAVQTYGQQSAWQRLMKNGMRKDFSWAASAKSYTEIYQQLRDRGARTNAAS
jgi:starch synthase